MLLRRQWFACYQPMNCVPMPHKPSTAYQVPRPFYVVATFLLRANLDFFEAPVSIMIGLDYLPSFMHVVGS